MRNQTAVAPLLLAWMASGELIRAQPPDFGFEWVTIGAVGNLAFPYRDPINGLIEGRGRVDYEYRIGRLEVTTGQWLEFINAFAAQPGAPIDIFGPRFWGAQRDPNYGGPGRQYVLRNVPNAELLPVDGISWEDAARFCNWLHNGRPSSLSSLQTGAYDTSLFGTPHHQWPPHLRQRLPGARFWIPSLDEWLKAVHYDPNRFGPGQEGWWLDKNGQDTTNISGPPGTGQTSAGWLHPTEPWVEWDIPLGAYADSRSPWGLFDTSGGASEWLEEVFHNARGHAGSFAGQQMYELWDTVFGIGGQTPTIRINGLRLASAVPAPNGAVSVVIVGFWFLNRRRR